MDLLRVFDIAFRVVNMIRLMLASRRDTWGAEIAEPISALLEMEGTMILDLALTVSGKPLGIVLSGHL